MPVRSWRSRRSDEASSGVPVHARAIELAPPRTAPIAVPALPAPIPKPALPREDSWREADARDAPRDAARAAPTSASCAIDSARCAVPADRDRQPGALGRTIADLGGAHGQHGDTAAVALAPPSPRSDGAFAMRARARCSRRANISPAGAMGRPTSSGGGIAPRTRADSKIRRCGVFTRGVIIVIYITLNTPATDGWRREMPVQTDRVAPFSCEDPPTSA